jgi:hypothetical protein
MSIQKTITDEAGKVTTVISEWEDEVESKWQQVHSKISQVLHHVETAARASGWASIAYAAWAFAKHLIP